jgi:heme/copper-type cytochrome/quinol oxidase subunit 1
MKSSTFPNRFGLWYNSLVKNCNHKGLGIYYLLTAFIFGISGTLISVLIRIAWEFGNEKESVTGCPFPSLLIRKLHQIHFVFLLILLGY